MKIGVISDTHDRCDHIKALVKMLEDEDIEALLHLGDFVAPFAAKQFADIARHVMFHAVFGNNDGEKEGLRNIIQEWGSIQDGPMRLELGGKVIVIDHYPRSAEEISGRWPDADYYFSGHTHEPVDERVGSLRIINPGEACEWVSGHARAGVLDTADNSFKTLSLR